MPDQPDPAEPRTPLNPTYYPGDLRAALIAAAVEIIKDDGLAALTLRAVARKAGVSHAAPAHHVGDRAGLLAAVAIAGHALLNRRMATAAAELPAEAPPGAVIATGITTYVAFAAEHPEYYGPMFRRELWADHAATVDATLRDGFDQLRSVVTAEQVRGWAPEVDPDAATLAVWSLAHGMASLAESGATATITVDPTAVASLLTSIGATGQTCAGLGA